MFINDSKKSAAEYQARYCQFRLSALRILQPYLNMTRQIQANSVYKISKAWFNKIRSKKQTCSLKNRSGTVCSNKGLGAVHERNLKGISFCKENICQVQTAELSRSLADVSLLCRRSLASSRNLCPSRGEDCVMRERTELLRKRLESLHTKCPKNVCQRL